MLRNSKLRKVRQSNLVAMCCCVLAAAATIWLASTNTASLINFTERAAIASAAMNMPQGGIELIKERFENEIMTTMPTKDEIQSPAANDKANAKPTKPAAEPTPDANIFEVPQTKPQTEQLEPNDVTAEPTETEKQPTIPNKYRGEIASEDFSGKAGDTVLAFGNALIKNDTKQTLPKIEKILETDYDLDFSGNSTPDEPQVLIFHTHATESFEKYDSKFYDTRNTWRSTDNNINMVAVGNAMQAVLEENGVGVVHDTTQHDYPSYEGSYERSAVTIQDYLDKYPSIKVVIDIHRDAMEREDGTIVKPVATIDGKKAAQIMVIIGCDDGTMNMPNWRKNLRFAANFVDRAQTMFPGLMRPIFFCYRKYNMNMSDGSMLLEFGSNGNTLEEAMYSAKLAGAALAEMITNDKDSENNNEQEN